MSDYKLVLKSGLNFYHVASAFQKCIRRGMEHEALYFGSEFFISGYANYAWNRMLVIACEDVGIADPMVAVQINALHEVYLKMKTKANDHMPERLPFTQAIMVLARCQKSRLVDNKICDYFFLRETIPVPVFPDFVFDMHTSEGKRKGRGNDHFYEEAAQIENCPEWLQKEEYEYRDLVWEKYKNQEVTDVDKKEKRRAAKLGESSTQLKMNLEDE